MPQPWGLALWAFCLLGLVGGAVAFFAFSGATPGLPPIATGVAVMVVVLAVVALVSRGRSG